MTHDLEKQEQEQKIMKVQMLTKFSSMFIMIASQNAEIKRKLLKYLENPTYPNMYCLYEDIENTAISFLIDEKKHIEQLSNVDATVKGDIKKRIELADNLHKKGIL